MNQLHSKSVVVGIDGSQAGVNAAKWAVDEAITRQLPLRLVHVAGRRGSRSTSAQPSDWEVEAGETALYQAEVAVHGMGKPVEVETVLLSGDPEQVLIDESLDAALVCVGTDQRRWAVDKLLGATEAALASRAHCPVAIIRTSPDGTPARPGVIAVVLNDEPDNEEVIHQAMEEGRRRNATVRQIDRRLNSWIRRYPDVPVQIVAAGTGSRSSENRSSAIELAVVGRADASHIADLGTPNYHPIVGYPSCSVLIVRD
ncbi:universal stress protein [Mycobacterium vulneris]|jgi:nucleotide-binding universal stress UspA family protein|uniref:Universal stress protein n=1 Tax=Mycolicibacterium vulneris TaxID=547163 RepID=A0A1X2KRM4_9MYCO|nr:universal stress protein [Mycolicibacterium vulneris]OSC24430.1 universal stress protein [Mycolicibacterium vulneris]